MIKLVMGALLLASTAMAQTASPPNQAGTAERPSGSTESTTRSKSSSAKASGTKSSSAAASNKPLPQPSLKEKLESGDRAIPSYKAEKDAGIHKAKYRYSPRRTETGARKDTMDKKKSQ